MSYTCVNLIIIFMDEFHTSERKKGNSICRNNTFDLMTVRDHNIIECEDDSNIKKTLECNETD